MKRLNLDDYKQVEFKPSKKGGILTIKEGDNIIYVYMSKKMLRILRNQITDVLNYPSGLIKD